MQLTTTSLKTPYIRRHYTSKPQIPKRTINRRSLQCAAQEEQFTPQEMEEAQKQYEELMKNPETRQRMEQLEQALKDPKVMQAQQDMMAAMQSEQMQEKIEQVRNDPELVDMFDEIESGGPQAIFKYLNNPQMLQKFSAKLGDVQSVIDEQKQQAQAAGPSKPPPPPPEVNNLIDAAKLGDMEALEDFLAVGKDVNCTDEEGRTPLHYAVAYNKAECVAFLVGAGASLEAVENKKNTPLHYACGYARKAMISLLLDNGADISMKNDAGKTPFDLINDEPRNPINQENDLMKKLLGDV
eukprot:TRINITY_DN1813_c0_g1_i1.p1 TRINITY_DN1813_c0_g1~~TRINITY_DN1813_c0_g1_i1.p1  ORF type:complete len:335 (-),score=60.08 TRINITY_DN1813_c0_g1_i1:306-1196(-)